MGLFGQQSAVNQPLSFLISISFFFSRPILCPLSNVIIFFGIGDQFFFSWCSRWIVRRAILHHRPTIGRQFVMSVVGRSTCGHLEIFKCRPADDRKSSEGRLVYRSILTNCGRWTTDSIRITFYIYRSISGSQADNAMLQISFVNKLKLWP